MQKLQKPLKNVNLFGGYTFLVFSSRTDIRHESLVGLVLM